MKSLEELISDPGLFPGAIYADRCFFDCHRVNRQILTESSFLDQRMTDRTGEKAQASFSYGELEALGKTPLKGPVNYIFHTSFCRSTLMAQALHVDGINFSLKEPGILLSLAESCRHTRALQEKENIRHSMAAILRLITGLIRDSESVVIKPTNFANNLLPFAVESGSKVLLMYSDLRSYLVSILRYGERGRAFSRQLFSRLMSDCDFFANMDPGQALLLTDLMIAALSWKQQIAEFSKALSNAGPGQIRTLNSAVFSDNREEVLARVFDFFNIPVNGNQVERIVSGPVFQQHSKSGKAIDDAEIHRQTMEIEKKFAEDIESTLKWAYSHTFAQQARAPLPCNILETTSTLGERLED